MRPAGARTTPGCGRGSVWGDGASGRSPREGRGAYGAFRHGRSGAQVASHPAGVHRNRSDAERPDPGRAEEVRGGSRECLQELRTGVAAAPAVYTDDTGWRIHGETAHLMTFDTDQPTVFQIRGRHHNEAVRELIPADYAGVMVTYRGKSYDAEEFLGVKQQKCLDHLKENINEV